MIKSMTGFGRGEHEKDERKITTEIKSVNHRYLEINVRMPRNLGFLENEVRSFVKQNLSRGKIDIFISYEDTSNKQNQIKFNLELAREYQKYFELISDEFSIENDIKVSHMTRYPEILILEEKDNNQEELWEILKESISRALTQLIEARKTEGELLKLDIVNKLNHLLSIVDFVKEKSPLIVEAYKEKLENRLKDLLDNIPIDETRIGLEMAIFADKACIDEEIVRLQSHIEHMIGTLEMDESIGRKLDFLTQEMNREANTILSKANAIDISNQALELKTEIEKIREQIQNIE